MWPNVNALPLVAKQCRLGQNESTLSDAGCDMLLFDALANLQQSSMLWMLTSSAGVVHKAQLHMSGLAA